MSTVYLNGKAVHLDPSMSLGKGGEADIFDIGNGLALKLFKPPNHPDYAGLPVEQQGARDRIAIHQTKLKAIPTTLPDRVVLPRDLVTDAKGKTILGYTMRKISSAEVLLRYAEQSFRQSGISNDTVVQIFTDLHYTVQGVHRENVVIGDFNDLNVLVTGTDAFVIDADSFQFGQYPCRVFTARFVDPLLCSPHTSSLMLSGMHNQSSDWYAYSVMLMQSLLYVDPYGGVYKPKDLNKRIPHNARPLHRITVFDPEVVYPRPATHYSVLPDTLLDVFYRMFVNDERMEFPLPLISQLRWTRCSVCGIEHARSQCPHCKTVSPVAQVSRVAGKVIATRLFRTSGRIVYATSQDGNVVWLYHEGGSFRRENGTVILSGDADPYMRYRINGERTLLAKGNRLVTLSPRAVPETTFVDSMGSLPMFDANGTYRYWTYNGQLYRDGDLISGRRWADFRIGSVLANQTLFWVGPAFGFGFYRAGNLSVAFVFDAKQAGINDTVQLPVFRGQLVDSTCVFTHQRCWFFLTLRSGGKNINYCTVIRKDGVVESTTSAEEGDGSWLGTIRGKCATGNFLFSPTDEGIVRVTQDNGQIGSRVVYSDTEQFVDSGTSLFLSGNGAIYAISAHEVHELKLV